jgi:heme O synthase-like polyprenyltransferase
VKSTQLARAPSQRAAIANFHASLAYLALLLGAAIVDAMTKA